MQINTIKISKKNLGIALTPSSLTDQADQSINIPDSDTNCLSTKSLRKGALVTFVNLHGNTIQE